MIFNGKVKKLLLFALGCACINTNIAFAENIDELAFVSIRHGDAHIFTSKGLETDKQLTFGKNINTQPTWSADGKKIAFTSTREGLSKIFIMDFDGKNQRRLTKDTHIETAPSWSPDGNAITFYSRNLATGNVDLCIFEMESSAIVRVSADGNDKGPDIPVWSADSKKLAFLELNADGKTEIWVVNRDGSAARSISTKVSQRNKAQANFSPDGRKVAYVADLKGPISIMVTNLDTGETVNLTEGVLAAHEQPRWSADGKQILFASTRDDEMRTRTDIFVMDADGKNIRNLSKHQSEDYAPQWTVDNKRAVFTSLRSGTSQLFVLDVATGNVSRLTENKSHDMDFSIRPLVMNN